MINKYILLLLDGFSAHHSALERLRLRNLVLFNVRIEFLPANTTSLSQSMNQGIIRT